MRLILRDLDGLRTFVRGWLNDEAHGDDRIAAELSGEDADLDEVLATILNTTICRALAFFDFALETGEEEPLDTARSLLGTAVSLADNAENVPLWWMTNLCRHLIDDLWQHSLHQEPADGTARRRGGAISRPASSCSSARSTPGKRRGGALAVAARGGPTFDGRYGRSVVALPTSAGKTRVAEIAALMTLSSARRVLIVTPLRALSAQTERSFREDLRALGLSVSSLYGASGLSAGDEDALRSREIVIATPEKLDFALRSDPSLIDDVGLIVLDEGHMIGPSEREIRYETLVQRLLRRSDAAERRIVCLSAILPSGDELERSDRMDSVDEPGDAVRSDWRPTRQRFGMLAWRGRGARLTLDLTNNGPFLDNFVVQKAASRAREEALSAEDIAPDVVRRVGVCGAGQADADLSRRKRTGSRGTASRSSISASVAISPRCSTTRHRSPAPLKSARNGSAKTIRRWPA